MYYQCHPCRLKPFATAVSLLTFQLLIHLAMAQAASSRSAKQQRPRPEDGSLTHRLPLPDNSIDVDLSPPQDREGSLVAVAVLLLQQGISLLKKTVKTDKQVHILAL